jgi:hypothetical protein
LLGINPIDLSAIVFGKGISYLFGMKPALAEHKPGEPPLSAEQLRVFEDAMVDPKLLSLLKDTELAARLRSGLAAENAFMDQMQRDIDIEYAQKDKRVRKEQAEIRFMRGLVWDALALAITKLAPAPQELIDTRIVTRGDLVAIRRTMPTFNTHFVFNYWRNTTRKVTLTDLWDTSLNVAIPYCDVVVTENSWRDVATRNGLDTLYDTKVVSSPDELARIIDG